MNSKFICILLMGVAGCGKTSVGSLLAKKINAFFIEADNFHGEANINKMSSGKPWFSLVLFGLLRCHVFQRFVVDIWRRFYLIEK